MLAAFQTMRGVSDKTENVNPFPAIIAYLGEGRSSCSNLKVRFCDYGIAETSRTHR